MFSACDFMFLLFYTKGLDCGIMNSCKIRNIQYVYCGCCFKHNAIYLSFCVKKNIIREYIKELVYSYRVVFIEQDRTKKVF